MKDHITVCVPTYRRNHMLERLLRRLALQESNGLFDLSVVVVDNDARGIARDVVRRVGEQLGVDVSYVIEPEKNVAAARNRALRGARGNYIGIIDDDELPPPLWLITLYRAIGTFDADGCLGPVHPFFEGKPPSWLVKGRFCERPVHRTGTVLNWNQTRTGNVLLKREVFDSNGLQFDIRFGSGGSDREFFKRAISVGCRFVAVEEAPVFECVPPDRWKRRYYIRRALLNGCNAHRIAASDLRGLLWVGALLKSALAVVAYAAALPVCTLFGVHVLVACLERGCHHLSRLLAMGGIELARTRHL